MIARLARRRILRARRTAPGRNEAGGPDLIGRDLAADPPRRVAGLDWLPALLAGAMVAALGIAGLRTDLIRVRYALTEAVRAETELKQERRELLARVGALRDPARLQRLAAERGFVRPQRVIELPDPSGAAR